MHCKCPPHHFHPGVVKELCKPLALMRVIHVDHQHRHCRRNAKPAWYICIGHTNEETTIAIAGLREHGALHHCSTLTHTHDMVLRLPRAKFFIAGGTVCPQNQGTRWTTIAQEGIEVLPHRRHGVVLAAGRGVKTDDSEEALAWGERRRPPITL